MKRLNNELLLKVTANLVGQTFAATVAHAANTGFASGGVTCKLGALCFYSSSVLIDSFVLRNPPERKARNRQAVKKPHFDFFSTSQEVYKWILS